MAFELEDFTPVKITSVNPRSERHGPEELHPAVDIGISLTTCNDILSALDGKLLDALYTKNANADQGGQQSLDGVEEVSHLPNLKFPLMGALKWKKELIGYTLTVMHGVGSDIVLTGCKVSKFTIDPKEGGSVELSFRCWCKTRWTSCSRRLKWLVHSKSWTTPCPLTASRRKWKTPPPLR